MGSAPIDRGPDKPPDFNMRFVAEMAKKTLFFKKPYHWGCKVDCLQQL